MGSFAMVFLVTFVSFSSSWDHDSHVVVEEYDLYCYDPTHQAREQLAHSALSVCSSLREQLAC